MLEALLKVALYLPKQILPFRGHDQPINNQVITLRMFGNSTACDVLMEVEKNKTNFGLQALGCSPLAYNNMELLVSK